MGSQYIPPPEQNVVNVGDEISINALDGIAQASPALSSTNPVATMSGGTFTGKVSGTPVAGSAGLNAGTVGTTPTTLANGDIWIGTTLNFRSSDGSNRPVPVLNSGNVFNATTSTIPVIQTIQGATSSQPSIEARHFGSGPAILISQRGTGDALRIDDELNDSTPFVVNADGKVGVRKASPGWELDVHGTINASQVRVDQVPVAQAVAQFLFSGATVAQTTTSILVAVSYTDTNWSNYNSGGNDQNGSEIPQANVGTSVNEISWDGSQFVSSGTASYVGSGTLLVTFTDSNYNTVYVYSDGNGGVTYDPPSYF